VTVCCAPLTCAVGVDLATRAAFTAVTTTGCGVACTGGAVGGGVWPVGGGTTTVIGPQ